MILDKRRPMYLIAYDWKSYHGKWLAAGFLVLDWPIFFLEMYKWDPDEYGSYANCADMLHLLSIVLKIRRAWVWCFNNILEKKSIRFHHKQDEEEEAVCLFSIIVNGFRWPGCWPSSHQSDTNTQHTMLKLRPREGKSYFELQNMSCVSS